MIDHVGIKVSSFKNSLSFYTAALEPVGYTIKYEGNTTAGFAARGDIDFWMEEAVPTQALHLAFHTENREIVDRFYHAAIQAGGKDNGKPGLRPHYHKNYYAAFVFDPDGNNIEVVCHKPTTEL